MSLRPFDAFFNPVIRHRPYPMHFMDHFHWPTSRRTAADDEFDEFIRSVDDRFSGMLMHLNEAPRSVAVHKGDEGGSNPTKFEMKIAVQDFGPEDLKVKVQGDNLVVEAKREEKKEEEGMYAHSYREFRRTFPIPEGVDKKNLTSALHGGVLEIEAPRLTPIEKAPEKKKIEVTHMEE